VAAIGAFGMPGTSVFGLIALVMSVILLYQISHLSGMKKTETESAKAAGETEEVKNNWKEFSKLTLAIISRSVLFVGCNTFIPLYWIHNFGQSKAAGAAALTCFCTFGVISNFIGGMLSDRFGYLRIIRLSYVVLIPSIVLFGLVDNLYAAFALLLPLGFSLYAPFSSMVVLGQKYLAKNIGFASGVTLGLATSMGGIVAPLLGWIADGYGLPRAIQSMTIVAVIGTVAAFLLVSLNRRTD
ncbi:MFS transporter, partial [Bilophila wadsworthia]